MKKILLFILLLLILFSCYKSSVKLANKKDSQESKNIESLKTIDHIDSNVPTDEFVYLFFDRSYFVKKQVNNAKAPASKLVEGNTADYKAVIDWQVEGDGRYIKFMNIKTGKVYIVKEGDTKGEAVLLNRNLFYYKFKIGNMIVKVKR